MLSFFDFLASSSSSSSLSPSSTARPPASGVGQACRGHTAAVQLQPPQLHPVLEGDEEEEDDDDDAAMLMMMMVMMMVMMM